MPYSRSFLSKALSTLSSVCPPYHWPQDLTAHSSFLNALCSPPAAHSFCLSFCITVVVPPLFWERRILQKEALAGKVGQMKAEGNLRFKNYPQKHVKKKYVCSTLTLRGNVRYLLRHSVMAPWLCVPVSTQLLLLRMSWSRKSLGAKCHLSFYFTYLTNN